MRHQLSCLLLACLVAPVAGQSIVELQPQASRHEEAWRIDSFLDDSGLRERMILHMAFDREESLWIAASDGLYRYDGYTWRRFSSADGLPTDYIRCVTFTRDGRMWLGTDKGAGTYDGSHFDDSETRAGLAGPSVRRIVEDDDGSLWFSCDRWPDRSVSAGLTRLREGVFTTWRAQDGLPSDYVSDVFVDSKRRRFVLTDKGLAQFEGDGFRLPLLEAGLERADVYAWSMAESPEHGLILSTARDLFIHRGGVWNRKQIDSATDYELRPTLAATRDGAIVSCSSGPQATFREWDGAGFISTSSEFIGRDSGVQIVLEAPDGSIWAGGTNLLVRWQRVGGEWEVYPDLPMPQLVDSSAGVWFADADRVVRFHSGQWQEFPGMHGEVVEDGDGAIWMASGRRPVRWTPEGATSFDESETGVRRMRSPRTDARGRYWCIGPGRDGLDRAVCFDDGRWLSQTLTRDLEESVRFVRPGPREGMWCVVWNPSRAGGRLLHVRDDSVREELLPAFVRDPPQMLAGYDGRLWIYGLFGLYSLEPGATEWTRFDGLTGNHVVHAEELGDQLWVSMLGSSGGVGGLGRYVRGRQWDVYAETSRRPLGRDGNERMFFSGSDRIYTIRRERGERPLSLTLPEPIGMSVVVAGTGGELWIGSDQYVLRYHPDDAPPLTLLEGMSEVHSGGDPGLRVRGVDRFKPYDSGATFAVSYRLDGAEWTPFEPLSSDGRLELEQVSAGEHEIRVRVMDESLASDPLPAALGFRVHPIPIQERPWFAPLMLGLLIIIGVLALVSFAARRKLKLQAHGLEATVRQRTAELSAGERKYRSLFEQSRDAIYLVDVHGRITDCNGAARGLLGVGLEESLDWSVIDLLEDDQGAAALEDSTALGATRNVQCRLRNRDGVPLSVEVTGCERHGEDGELAGYQVSMRDVTHQLEIEESLRQRHKMEAIGRMAGGIAHDFNNILTGILGYAELLADDRLGSARARADAGLILKEAERARNLIRQIQTFSRGQTTRPPVIDACSTLEGLRDLLVGLVGEGVSLELDSGFGPSRVAVDPGQLEQVVVNLAVNARDAMPEGGRLEIRCATIELDTEAARSARLPNPGPHVHLVVRDTGQGMDAGTRSKVFEPFFTTKPPGRGTGLGLAIVYGIVQQVGGAVAIESELGRGTSVDVFLPCCLPAAPSTDSPDAPPHDGGDRARVLVVDDEPQVRGLVRKILEDSGYEVLDAADGYAALRLVRDGSAIDLTITDLVMPDMDGRELARRLREVDPDAGILYMSGYSTENGAAPLVPMLHKPFQASRLRREVRELLKQR